MYHPMISEVRTVFTYQFYTSSLGENGVRYRGPVLFDKLIIEGFSHTVSEAVFVKQFNLSIKICILWYWKYQISIKILKRKIHKKPRSLNYYIFVMHLIFSHYIMLWFFSKTCLFCTSATGVPLSFIVVWINVFVRFEAHKPIGVSCSQCHTGKNCVYQWMS